MLTTIEEQAGALSSEGRVEILKALIERGEVSVGALTQATGLSGSAVSQHLTKLRYTGFVLRSREAQTMFYRIREGAGAELLRFLKEIPR